MKQQSLLQVDEAGYGAFSDPNFLNVSTKRREIHELDYVQPKRPATPSVGLKKSVRILSKKNNENMVSQKVHKKVSTV